MPPSSPFLLSTPRLLLRAPADVDAHALADFYQRNKTHIARWGPPRAPDWTTTVACAQRLAQWSADHQAGCGLSLTMYLAQAPQRVIGQCHFSQISRGPHQSAMLGYNLDADSQGAGLMQEALQAACDHMYSPAIRLHRIQAAVQPDNRRSQALLQRMGFHHEGRARGYLFVDGAWRDHDCYAKLNPDWPDDQAPAAS